MSGALGNFTSPLEWKLPPTGRTLTGGVRYFEVWVLHWDAPHGERWWNLGEFRYDDPELVAIVRELVELDTPTKGYWASQYAASVAA
jgi:hypothetical protein